MQTHIHHSTYPEIAETHRITRLFRVSKVLFFTFAGILIATIVFPATNKARKRSLIQWWSGRLLAAFNLRIVKLGQLPSTDLSNTMFIANHISWADIHALNSMIPLRFIAKSEIRSWPVFGYLAHKANVLFIDRSKRHDAARIVETTSASLVAGDNLCLFPEGTTTNGTEVRPFKSSLIEAAIQANATLWPIAVRYPKLDGTINTSVAYAGDTTLLESVKQVLLQKQPVIELHFLTPINLSALADHEKDRRSLTLNIQQAIQNKLNINATNI